MRLEESKTQDGQVITEQVAQPQPTVSELTGASNLVDPQLRAYLQLPAIRPYVRSLTAGITKNARSPYGRARAISNFFADPANGFAYSLQSAVGDSGDELTDFLR